MTDDFFRDLGANSLLMARFSTRIRTEFPTTGISMREIYSAPTVRALAALVGSPQGAAAPEERREEPHVASDLAYWGTGAYQILASLVVTWGMLAFMYRGLEWTLSAPASGLYVRMVVFCAASFLLLALLPVAAKWLLIGRWRQGTFPIWGVAYAKFWTVKTLIRMSPLAFVPGTPLYNAYLRALGARVDWSAMVLCAPPVCTDLVEIGAGAVVGRGVEAQGYKAVAGRIVTGPIRIGAGAYVGDSAVLDIHTELEEGAELGHTSALHEGQTARAGCSYHGSPAELTSTRFRSLPSAEVSLIRRLADSFAQVGPWVFVVGPVMVMIFKLINPSDATGMGDVAPIAGPPVDTIAALPYLLTYSTLGFLRLTPAWLRGGDGGPASGVAVPARGADLSAVRPAAFPAAGHHPDLELQVFQPAVRRQFVRRPLPAGGWVPVQRHAADGVQFRRRSKAMTCRSYASSAVGPWCPTT